MIAQVGEVGLDQLLGPCRSQIDPVEPTQLEGLEYYAHYQGQAVEGQWQGPKALQGRVGRNSQNGRKAMAAPGLQVDRGGLAAHVEDVY